MKGKTKPNRPTESKSQILKHQRKIERSLERLANNPDPAVSNSVNQSEIQKGLENGEYLGL